MPLSNVLQPIITGLTDIVSTGNALHDQIIGTPEIVEGPDIDLVVSAWDNVRIDLSVTRSQALY
jgi:hypothetical protein